MRSSADILVVGRQRAQRITGRELACEQALCLGNRRELEERFEFSFILICKSTKKNQANHGPLSNPGTRVGSQFGADSQTD